MIKKKIIYLFVNNKVIQGLYRIQYSFTINLVVTYIYIIFIAKNVFTKNIFFYNLK